MVIILTTKFNIQKYYMVITLFYVFGSDLRANSKFPITFIGRPMHLFV